MIVNPERLFMHVPPGSVLRYKLALIEHFFLKPIGEVFDITITSAYRTTDQQASLKNADGSPVPRALKAKGIGQHPLGEAVDFTTPELRTCWEWCLEELRPWQAIIEWRSNPDKRCIHLSLPSEVETIIPKRLIYYAGQTQHWRGKWPETMDA